MFIGFSLRITENQFTVRLPPEVMGKNPAVHCKPLCMSSAESIVRFLPAALRSKGIEMNPVIRFYTQLCFCCDCVSDAMMYNPAGSGRKLLGIGIFFCSTVAHCGGLARFVKDRIRFGDTPASCSERDQLINGNIYSFLFCRIMHTRLKTVWFSEWIYYSMEP